MSYGYQYPQSAGHGTPNLSGPNSMYGSSAAMMPVATSVMNNPHGSSNAPPPHHFRMGAGPNSVPPTHPQHQAIRAAGPQYFNSINSPMNSAAAGYMMAGAPKTFSNPHHPALFKVRGVTCLLILENDIRTRIVVFQLPNVSSWFRKLVMLKHFLSI